MAKVLENNDQIGKLTGSFADKAVEALAGNWFERADGGQRFALGAIVAAATLGPLGQGVLAAARALYSSALPSSEQLTAVWWLAVLTLPVFAAAATAMYFIGKGHPMVILGLAAIAATGGSAVMGEIGVPTHLGDVYCYNDGVVLENQCREFDSLGFTSASNAADGSLEILSLAFSYTADARGSLMALCGLAAGAGGGYLARRESEPN